MSTSTASTSILVLPPPNPSPTHHGHTSRQRPAPCVTLPTEETDIDVVPFIRRELFSTSKIQDSCVVQTDVRILEDITSVIYMIMSSVPHKYYPHVPTNWAIPRGIVGPNIFDSDFRVRSNQDAGCYSCSALLCCI